MSGIIDSLNEHKYRYMNLSVNAANGPILDKVITALIPLVALLIKIN